jgi:hypothetical protein
MSFSRLRTWSLGLSATIMTLFALLIAAIAVPSARAGTYRVAQCNPGRGAGHADASFQSNSTHYVSAAGCRKGGNGLTVTHAASSTHHGSWGAWTLTAPRGTDMVGTSVTVSGRGQGGHVPEVLVGRPSGSWTPIGDASGDPHRIEWVGTGVRSLSGRLRCSRDDCGPGGSAIVRLKRAILTLEDPLAPTLDLSGTLFATGSRRGDQLVKPRVGDTGGGVRRVLVDVNGRPIAARARRCELAGSLALRVRPCPSRATPSFAADTASAPFVQGRNTVRVCALDYAPDTSANQACRTRGVRVDNLCPLSGVPGGTQLVARIEGRDRARVGRGEPATVSGHLLDAGGSGVAGARVCVATRVRLDGRTETVAARPTTGSGGRFAVDLPAGPNREVRVAYWPDAKAAVERFLNLETRADPWLRLRPRRELHNGDRLHFRVRIPAPSKADRDVHLQVRSGGHWLGLRDGRTNANGVWRTGYRFHATTGRRRYAFRALVPAQPGYPYVAGRSRIKHQVVIGSG